MLEPAPFQTLDQILPVFWVVVQVDDLSLIMPFDLLSASPVEGRLQLLMKKRNLSPLCLPFHLEGSGRNEAERWGAGTRSEEICMSFLFSNIYELL